MNLITKKWIKYKNKEIKIIKKDGKIIVENPSSRHGYIMLPKFINSDKNHFVFEGTTITGNACILFAMDLKKNVIGEASLNSISTLLEDKSSKYLVAIKILPYSKVEINKIDISNKSKKDIINESLKYDNLIIAPAYPSLENKYLCGFVHSRLKLYQESGFKFDLVVAHEYQSVCKYNFEGIDVLRVPFSELRKILTTKKYKKILVHFFDQNYSNIFDACDLSESELFLWVHGPETLYWDWPKFTTPYFQKNNNLNDYQIEQFKKNDQLIFRYNNMKNVHWIFVSEWIKNQSEKLINIKFNNYEIIPNIIDSNNFNYIEKNSDARKKIFFLRRFDDCNKYAIDVNVRCILELSRREFFKDLEFNIYGIGDNYEKLVKPLKEFSNVHLYPKFLTHEEIADIHKQNGIALFATRYDAQGVSMCEAAMSGLTIVASNNDAIKEFLPKDLLLADTENYIEYADIIEYYYKNPQKFLEYSKKCHDFVAKKCSFNETIKKEISYIESQSFKKAESKIKAIDNPVLSIIVPSYNVEDYLEHGIKSILNHSNSNKLEILIVNDGSKDNTLCIAKQLMNKYNYDKKNQVIKLIDKENGGHGSTINVGIEQATGKYIRIIDGDDWVNSQELNKLIDILEAETSDIVITDYSQDLADIDKVVKQEIYNFMTPGLKYNFDDLCYDGYGFGEWGPILATANFKSEILKKSNYKLSEKSFYVDMEFDLFSIINAETITYYDLDIYRYFIGRSGQSISKQSYIKNYKHHEKVLLRLINIVSNDNTISEAKKKYAKEKIIIPMIKAHYIILCDFLKNRSELVKFDKLLKKFPEYYYNNIVCTKYIRFQRKTHGLLLVFDKQIKFIYRKIRKV